MVYNMKCLRAADYAPRLLGARGEKILVFQNFF